MRVLLVDHDSEGLEAIARAIRGVLELDCVTSKGDALLLLRQNQYDVLIACERCVDGSGLDLLGRTTRTTTPLKRIFAAATDRLSLLGPRLAPFKVQRTIAYPIDLEELWLAIAQVTGTNDETDGTIERVVLDERGIPANGTTPRSPIPPRPPAPLREVRTAAPPPAPTPAPAIAASAGAGRAAVARVAQPAPEPPLRAPPPPRQPPQVRQPAAPATTSDTGRMRAIPPPVSTTDTGRMRAMSAAAPPPAPRREEPWVPETTVEEDFAEVAAQARMGVQRKAVDEVARRKKQRLITAGAVAAGVAGVLVFLIEKFYDPDARAREAAIAAEVTRMTEERKVNDNLTMIEIDIEKAIMENNLDVARQELAKLVQQSPQHPRREFLQASIDRAAELAKLAAQSGSATPAAGSAEPERPVTRPRAAERVAERPVERTPERVVARDPNRNSASGGNAASRTQRTAASAPTRTFGAPIGETVERTIPLNAPINATPTTTLTQRRDGNSFGGRTIEASDSAQGGTLNPTTAQPSNQNSAGSATPAMPPAAAPAPVVPTPVSVDVTPAKIIKRVTPVAPSGVPARVGGFVIVKFNISDSGRVSDVEVVESSPSGVFDDAARSAVRKWMYEPRKENGVAVASNSKARLVFEPAD
jgi:TonB family protein